MKHFIITFSIILILFQTGCKKDEIQDNIYKAGALSNNCYYSYSIDTIPSNDKCDICIDFNHDDNIDICFWIKTITAPSGHEYMSALSVLDSTFQLIVTEDSISPRILNFNDTLSVNDFWSNRPNAYWDYFRLARDYYVWTINQFENYTYWLNKTGYIGIRNENLSGLYKYGWIKISVETYTKVIVYEYAFMK